MLVSCVVDVQWLGPEEFGVLEGWYSGGRLNVIVDRAPWPSLLCPALVVSTTIVV